MLRGEKCLVSVGNRLDVPALETPDVSLQALEAFDTSAPERGFSDLSRDSGASKTEVFRLLAILEVEEPSRSTRRKGVIRDKGDVGRRWPRALCGHRQGVAEPRRSSPARAAPHGQPSDSRLANPG